MALRENLENVAEGIFISPVTSFFIDHPVIGIGLFSVVLGLLIGLSTVNYILAFALFAMAYNVNLGETGIVTFGHAAFIGLGAYGTGLFLVNVDVPAWLGMLGVGAGVVLATVGGIVIGWFAVRQRGIALALITLAFAQMVYFGAFHWTTLTGGDTGLYGMTNPELGIPGLVTLSTREPVVLFVTALSIVLGSVYLLAELKRRNIGRVFNAIRENEQRARYLGYDVDRYMLYSFIISAAFCGLAGALFTLSQGFVGVNILFWTHSGEVNFFAIFGGVQSFLGPAVGAALFITIQDRVQDIIDNWELPVGILFILVVIYFPRGLVGTARDKLEQAGLVREKGTEAERLTGDDRE